MYYTVKEFIDDYTPEREKTLAILSTLQDDFLTIGKPPNTIGEIIWALIKYITETASQIGLPVDVFAIKREQPHTIQEFTDLYTKCSKELLIAVTTNFIDSTLLQKDVVCGEEVLRGNSLHIILLQEVHFRAQIILLKNLE